MPTPAILSGLMFAVGISLLLRGKGWEAIVAPEVAPRGPVAPESGED